MRLFCPALRRTRSDSHESARCTGFSSEQQKTAKERIPSFQPTSGNCRSRRSSTTCSGVGPGMVATLWRKPCTYSLITRHGGYSLLSAMRCGSNAMQQAAVSWMERIYARGGPHSTFLRAGIGFNYRASPRTLAPGHH